MNGHRIFGLSVVVACCGAMLLASASRAEDVPSRLAGSLSCASASCHGRQEPRLAPANSRGDESTRWLNFDPHAKAGATLHGPKFQRILNLASTGKEIGPADALVYRRCAECHDPEGLSNAVPDNAALLADGNPGQRGIGCETCHGPGQGWLATHYLRDVDRPSLAAAGMVDTKDLLVRGRLCATCHVGGPEHDMNHDMIAAGHPPLRFELSAYHDLIERKHWTDAERIGTPHFKARLWVAGQVAIAKASLALLESRAVRAEAGERLTPWPEFAEYDCFACHQRLRPAADRPSAALKSSQPGIPGWQPWNLAVASPLLVKDEPDGPLTLLRTSMADHFTGRDPQLPAMAASTRRAIAAPAPDLTGAQLAQWIERQIHPDQSWAESCQQLLALKAAYLATRDEARKLNPPVRLVSSSASDGGRSEAERAIEARLATLTESLRFGSPDFEWPALDWDGLGPQPRGSAPPLSADQVPAALDHLATELKRRAEGNSP